MLAARDADARAVREHMTLLGITRPATAETPHVSVPMKMSQGINPTPNEEKNIMSKTQPLPLNTDLDDSALPNAHPWEGLVQSHAIEVLREPSLPEVGAARSVGAVRWATRFLMGYAVGD